MESRESRLTREVVNRWFNTPGQLPSLDIGRLADQLEHSHSIQKPPRGY